MRRLFFILVATLVSGVAMLAQPRNPYYERGYKADLQVGVSPARNYIVASSTLTQYRHAYGNFIQFLKIRRHGQENQGIPSKVAECFNKR